MRLVACVSGAVDLLLTFCFRWLPLDGTTYWILIYIRMAKEQENLAGYLKFFQGCVQKCEFGMESTTTVLNRNVYLAVKGLNGVYMRPAVPSKLGLIPIVFVVFVLSATPQTGGNGQGI